MTQYWYLEVLLSGAFGDRKVHYFAGNGIWTTDPEGVHYFPSETQAKQAAEASIFSQDIEIVECMRHAQNV